MNGVVKWSLDWQRSFEALRGDGWLFVASILQTLILNRAPRETLGWAETIATWEFHRLISCHLAAPILTTPAQVRQAFSFLEPSTAGEPLPLPEADFAYLREIDQNLSRRGITPPAKDWV